MTKVLFLLLFLVCLFIFRGMSVKVIVLYMVGGFANAALLST